MSKWILVGALALVLAAVGCKGKKSTLEDQLQTKPDTTAQQPAPYEPPAQPDEAMREEQLRRDAETALRPVYFGYNLYDLGEEARNTLAEVGQFMTKYPDVKIQIEGHCDERGSAEYNMALGQKRAEEAKNYLVSYGISSSRLTTNSWGEERPATQGNDESAWAKNRRGEFILQR